MTSSDCPKYAKCGASLCPMDSNSLSLCYWIPGEPICTNPEFAKLKFTILQRKLAKVIGETDTVFTYPMLNRHITIRRFTKGISADTSTDVRKDLELRWITEHLDRPKLQLSVEHLEKLKRGAKHI